MKYAALQYMWQYTATGKTEPEAWLHQSDILPHLAVRGVIIDKPALVDPKPNLLACFTLIFRSGISPSPQLLHVHAILYQ